MKEKDVEENIVYLINLDFQNKYSEGRDEWRGCGIIVSLTMIEHTSPSVFKRMIKSEIMKRLQ